MRESMTYSVIKGGINILLNKWHLIMDLMYQSEPFMQEGI